MVRIHIVSQDVLIIGENNIAAAPYIQILFVTRADCMLKVSGHLYALDQGSVIVLPGGVGGRLLYGRRCQFQSLQLHELTEDPFEMRGQVQRLLRGLTHLRPDTLRFSWMLMDMMRLQELQAIGEGQGKAAYARLYDLLVSMVSLGKTAVNEAAASFAPSTLIGDVKAYLNLFFTEPIALDNLAERFYVSGEHLCRAFKAQMGRTIIQYVNDLRVARAQALLRAGKTCAQARDESGFATSQHFIAQFKARNGLTPSQYRQGYTRNNGFLMTE